MGFFFVSDFAFEQTEHSPTTKKKMTTQDQHESGSGYNNLQTTNSSTSQSEVFESSNNPSNNNKFIKIEVENQIMGASMESLKMSKTLAGMLEGIFMKINYIKKN